MPRGPVPRRPPRPGQAPPAKKEPKFIVGQRTQDIKNANAELKSGQAKVASTRIVAKDPITLQGNAYVSIIGRTSMLNIQHAVDLYQAENDRYPKDYQRVHGTRSSRRTTSPCPSSRTTRSTATTRTSTSSSSSSIPDRKVQLLA